MYGLPEIAERLTSALGRDLPGAAAQLRLAPRPRRGWRPGEVPPGCREGAGLVLLFPLREEAAVVLTVRDGRLPQHAGQVSFPGGAVEAGETVEQGALREAREEIGLDGAAVRVLGRLSPLHIPVSRFVLHPVVATTMTRPALTPQPGEVQQILEVPLRVMAEARRCRVERRVRGSQEYDVPYLDLDGGKVWGATAMVLAELLALLGHAPDPRTE